MSAKTLYLIDGHAQFFRAYHALPSGMSSPVTHEPTNMTYGFVAMLLKVLRDYQPDYLAVVIDVAGDRETFRSEIDPEYKANREAAPDDFGPQVDRCLSVLETMGVPVLGVIPELRRLEEFPYMPSALYFFVADPIETMVGLQDAS